MIKTKESFAGEKEKERLFFHLTASYEQNFQGS